MYTLHQDYHVNPADLPDENSPPPPNPFSPTPGASSSRGSLHSNASHGDSILFAINPGGSVNLPFRSYARNSKDEPPGMMDMSGYPRALQRSPVHPVSTTVNSTVWISQSMSIA